MNRRTPEQWQALFDAQQASGLNQAQFCRQQGLCAKHFSLRRKQLLGDNTQPIPSSTFVTVQPPQVRPQQSVSIRYQDVEITVPQVEIGLITQLVKHLL